MNISLFYTLNSLAAIPTVATLAHFFAVTFPYIVTLFVALFLLFRFREVLRSGALFQAVRIRIKESFFVVVSVGGAWLAAKILKSLFHIARPFTMLPNVHVLFPESGYSFPSSHATIFVALAVAIYMLDRKIGSIFILSAFLIGLARIISGVHYPADILAGFVLGTLVTLIVSRFYTHKDQS